MKKGFTLAEIMILISIILILIAMIIPSVVKVRQMRQYGGKTEQQFLEDQERVKEQAIKNQQLYEAWIKYTDNPKELSFEEWKALKDSGMLKDIMKEKESD